MRNTLFGLLLILLAIGFIGCKSEDESTIVQSAPTLDARTATVNASLVDIPSSVSKTSSTPSSSISGAHQKVFSTAPTTEDQPIWAVYEGVRQNVGALEEWAEMIEEFTEAIWPVINSSDSDEWINETPTAGEATKIAWSSGAAQGYDKKLEFFWGALGDQKGFEAYLTVNEVAETAKGAYTWDFTVAPNADNPSSNAKVQFVFDGTISPKEMEIKVQNMSSAQGEPQNAWIKASQDTSNVIRLWGNYYFPTMNWFDDATTDARNYIFAAIGYDETGQTADLKNKAVLKLVLPPAGLATTAFVSNYSVSAIFIEKIKEIWEGQGISVQDLKDWTSLLLTGATDYATLTYDHVIEILEWARAEAGSDATADSFANLIHATKMVNNAYFNSTGFQGTCYDPGADGTCDQGTATTVPSGFDTLDIDAVAADAPTPVVVKDLIVNFL